MILDLSKFKETVSVVPAEELAKASAEYVSQMDPGVHEVTVVDLHKMAQVGGEPSILVFNKKDPNWVQFNLVLQNAAGHQSRQLVMVPVNGCVLFKHTEGKDPTSMPWKNLNQFVAALGFEPEIDGLNSSLHFAKLIVETGGSILEKLIGLQLKLQLRWPEHALHLQYNREEKAHYLVNYEGLPVSDELSEPFHIEKYDVNTNPNPTGEVELVCKRANLPFTKNMDSTLMIHDVVRNDLTAFLPNKPSKPVAAFKPKAINIPSKPTLVQTALLQDAVPPTE